MEIEKKWAYCNIVSASENQVGFQVNYRGEKRIFLPEQVIGMMLQKIKQTLANNNSASKDIVLSIPSYFTQTERKAVLNAAKIADANVLKLVNESTASKNNRV